MLSSRLAAGLLALALLPGAALARSVYLNGVRIDDAKGLKNLKLEKVTVRIDDRGDVHVDAPGYQIRVVDESGKPIEPTAASSSEDEPIGRPSLTRRYYLVTEQTRPGSTGYDIDVYVNAKWIRKLKSGESQLYLDVTKHLVPGRNRVLLSSRREGEGTGATRDVFKVIIGEGMMGGDHVLIDRPVVEFQRTGADRDEVSKEFTFVTR